MGGEIAARVTKSGTGVDADRGNAEGCELVEMGAAKKSEAVEVEGETAMDLYTTLEPPASSLKA
jgi:hypothetical protein